MAEPFLSEIRIMSFGFAPKGWALCNGQLLPINQNQALFSILGTTYGGDGPQDDGPKRRSPWTWPLIALIVILALVLGFFLVRALASGSGGPTDPTTSAGGRSSTPASSASTSAGTSITLDSSKYVGRQYDAVKADLTGFRQPLVDLKTRCGTAPAPAIP